MKQTQQIMYTCQRQMGTLTQNEEQINNQIINCQFFYDQESLRIQVKQKYREHLRHINLRTKGQNTCIDALRHLLLLIFALLQQFWIEIIPQFIRGRYFAQKAPEIMQEYPYLNCGNIRFFLQRMKKQTKHFFIILEQKISYEECFEIQENLFENSEQSNKKLNYILQCQTISLNSDDLNFLQKDQNSPIKFANFLKIHTKCPLLLVCRYNFLEELKVMGEIELSQLGRQNFIELYDEIKKHISELKNLQSQCKRQVLTELLHGQI